MSSCLGWQEHPPSLTPGAKQSSKNQGIEEGNSQFSQGISKVASTAVQPRKLGHVTLLVDDCKRSAEFYSEVLGFRISDWVDDIFLWMRCNPDHHGLAFAKTSFVKMHHFA